MKILVDTSAWSEALRKRKSKFPKIIQSLKGLIEDGDACIIGPIKQELLSGYSNKKDFKILEDKLRAFPNLQIDDQDYIQAAEFSNQCRKIGIQGAHTDFLICAIAYRFNVPILTTDMDFLGYAKILPIINAKASS